MGLLGSFARQNYGRILDTLETMARANGGTLPRKWPDIASETLRYEPISLRVIMDGMRKGRVGGKQGRPVPAEYSERAKALYVPYRGSSERMHRIAALMDRGIRGVDAAERLGGSPGSIRVLMSRIRTARRAGDYTYQLPWAGLAAAPFADEEPH